MLLTLTLSDFVIVDKLHLDFDTGFTVLTGETGAGKSITLDALGLLMGDKADYSQVRHGAKDAQFSALFDISQLPNTQALLLEQGLLKEGDTELAIRRIIDAKGRSRSFINDQTVTLAQLKTVGEQLIDIHGQNAHHSLNNEATQRALLDEYSGNLALAKEVRLAYQSWQQQKQALNKAKTQSDLLEVERERLCWQINELSELNLIAGEWADLSQSHHTLAHAADLIEAASFVEQLVNEDELNLLRMVYQCQNKLSPLVQVHPKFEESLALLNSIEAELSEVAHAMRDVNSQIEIDPNELAKKEARINELVNIARKYRVDPEALPEKYQQLQDELAVLEAANDLDSLEKQVELAYEAYHTIAQKLSKKRNEAAQKLADETTAHMQDLAMAGAQFAISLHPLDDPQAYGLESVEYQVAMNKGAPLRALHKAASGGELSRISLALQVVTSQYTKVPTLIFDEVDTGIGGRVAQIVGKALKALGQHYQVLAITHLPQVAACGDQHWQVAKHETKEHTVSQIHVLNHDQRVHEVARMLGGEVVTDTTLQHAKELLSAP
ncbi:MAG: DNA repair protein RecN [Neisseriaceae bacterium]|nr:DNA repair protein RecN [Neisseriaceae bacterium]